MTENPIVWQGGFNIYGSWDKGSCKGANVCAVDLQGLYSDF